ncbi:MAG: glutamate-1-semialdehyde 2,1-aminomutase [Polynucleobacter sp. 24-46-87]|nr:MAG: glutamate-1-semialdehyde 2,1-aminomutase [Polynucleobacter sp. 32-46-5]OYY59278.1 MAG: glutamate-1-semialdehyde 2,1-aminomutase [Polynucleobacter sp. 35-46-207]OYZ39028.1 MAG: glutamate-1-semialdehyde 2,1-aminomutase [Polynucleobacter sp. 16-46-70]OZA15075.1 MAG: glutamate-1-semialdehyde 2,1-aminomutase [Polynucleobacter sp. 24-46-87]OZA42135.1 MAG: glutamate-1-semialdehyde 2,1-aminomutase [Polynucleobacter sp. 17-46-58]HQR83394.1 aminotransferase class III-fold pyridoxal phosphate-dep
MENQLALSIFGAGLGLWIAKKVYTRLQLSKAKHPSLAGHSRMAKRVARLIPHYSFTEEEFFRVDGAPQHIARLREMGFMRLSHVYQERFSKSVCLTNQAAEDISDLQFTGRYRVPFQFSNLVSKHLKSGSFMQSSSGVTLTDLDGNTFYDLTGSYGVNVLGYDFYKHAIEEGAKRVSDLGPVLGFYHPIVADNVRRLKEISGLDEISFHMSGTEAVMQAVRLARYHTKRSHVVRFCGAYHGWWEDVQPGIGNPLPPRETYTLKEVDQDTLRVLRNKKNIACVLVNPLQALHPNKGAPGDSSLLDSSRTAFFDRVAYTNWLKELRQVCSDNGIVLIFDEVFVGFRLAQGGAQEYFGVKADMVTYGKTLGGGLPIGVVCGKGDLMMRFKEDKPADICFARGTFNSHPYVMGAMQVFLESLSSESIRRMYTNLDERWNGHANTLNEKLVALDLPVRVANMSSIWTIYYTEPSRYNWMFQYYLKEQGLALSWIGTGRFIFSLNYSDADMTAVQDRFIRAAQCMKQDGWWWNEGGLSNKMIKRQILREMIFGKRAQPKSIP